MATTGSRRQQTAGYRQQCGQYGSMLVDAPALVPLNADVGPPVQTALRRYVGSYAEATAWIAAWSIIILAIGMSLEIRRLVIEGHGNEDKLAVEHSPSIVIYGIIIMTVSILWMVVITTSAICASRQGQSRPKIRRMGQYLIYSLVLFALGAIVLDLIQGLAFQHDYCTQSSERHLASAYCALNIIFIIMQVAAGITLYSTRRWPMASFSSTLS